MSASSIAASTVATSSNTGMRTERLAVATCLDSRGSSSFLRRVARVDERPVYHLGCPVARRTMTHLVSPGAAVAGTVILSCLTWAVVAHFVSVPRWYLDELYYMKAGVSVAQGDGLNFRGEPWGYGPLYPLVVGAIVRLTSDQELTYELAKAANALFFSLAAVPIYLLARRMLPPWPSVAATALCVLIPSSAYVSVVMTESLAYLLACWAVLAIVLALEHPTAARQLAAVVSILLAIAVRPQLVALYAGYLLALAIVWLAFPPQRDRLRAAPMSLWPTVLSLVAGVAWLAHPVITGEGLGGALGNYSVLATSYDPLDVVVWFVRSLGGLALYLVVVPMIVAPTMLARAWARGRAASERDGAFVALFVGLNVTGVGLVAAFVTTDYGHRILHDRYLFYLAPLWLIVFVAWLHEGLPRPVVPFAAGVAGTMAAVLVLPFGQIGKDNFFNQFEAVGTEMWGKAGLVAERLPLVSTWTLAAIFTVVLAAAAVLIPGRISWVLAACVVVGLIGNLLPGWRSAFIDATGQGVGSRGTRDWVDDRVGDDADVTVLFVARQCSEIERGASSVTDFFNRSVRGALTVGGEGPAAPRRAKIGDDGAVVLDDGRPVVAPYVVAQRGIALNGRSLAEGMTPRLVLWQVDGPLRIAGGLTEEELVAGGCERS